MGFRQRFKSLATCLMLTAGIHPIAGHTQEAVSAYPSRPVTIIIPLVPGGGGDAEARLYNARLTESLGKPFVNDYKPGAGTTIGTAFVAKARPDGYTLLGISPTLTIAPAFYKDLPYDVTRDFTPISQMTQRASIFVVNPKFPARNIAEFIAYAKAHPSEINWGTHSAGASSHLVGAWFQSLTNTRFTFVHYKGSNPLTLDLIANRVQATVLAASSGLPQVKAGKLRVLGISSAERTALLPGVPTVEEQGVPEFEYPSWFGILGPSGMAPALVAKLNAELAKAAAHPDVIRTLTAEGTTIIAGPAEKFRQLVEKETARWRKVVTDSGITLGE